MCSNMKCHEKNKNNKCRCVFNVVLVCVCAAVRSEGKAKRDEKEYKLLMQYLQQNLEGFRYIEVVEQVWWRQYGIGSEAERRGGVKKRKGAEVVGPRIWFMPWPDPGGFPLERAQDEAAASACGFANTEEYVATLQQYANAPYKDEDDRVFSSSFLCSLFRLALLSSLA